MTYTELFNSIQAYCENTFPATFLADGGTVSATQQINTFITQAEQRIYNAVQFPALRKNVSGNFTANNSFLACPADFLATHSLASVDSTGDYEHLLNKDVSFIRQAYPTITSYARPKYYAMYGPQSTDAKELVFVVGPTPDQNYTAILHYFFYPESITVAESGRTWLSDNFDSVLLYGSLVEAATFMKAEADILAQYTKQFQEALLLAKRLGDGFEKTDNYRRDATRSAV